MGVSWDRDNRVTPSARRERWVEVWERRLWSAFALIACPFGLALLLAYGWFG